MLYKINGKQPEIMGNTGYIAESADVIGDVLIHDKVSILFNAVLRGDMEYIEVGEGSNIQDCVVIHTGYNMPAIIGEGCTIGHGAIIHGCRIGDGTLVGMGAIILDGCEVGENCIIAAGSLVPQGTKIPDNTLFSKPVVDKTKTLSPVHIDLLKQSAIHYQEGIAAYKKLEKIKPEK